MNRRKLLTTIAKGAAVAALPGIGVAPASGTAGTAGSAGNLARPPGAGLRAATAARLPAPSRTSWSPRTRTARRCSIAT